MPAFLTAGAHLSESAYIASVWVFFAPIRRVEKMRHNILTRPLTAAALLILAISLGASAQVYRGQYNNRYDNQDRYDRVNRPDARDAINRLEGLSARLENDVNFTPSRRVLSIFQFRTVDSDALAQVRDFRRAVRQLRNNSGNGRDQDRSVNEVQLVLDRGVQLDRYLRLRTGSTMVDEDLSELRSNLHLLADAYGLSMPYYR
jgi:hypothetical protein